MTVDAHHLTFRLVGTTVPDGQLPLTDVADICRALQELNTRVSRLVAGQQIGRTGEAAARVAELRMTRLGPGSTVLDVGYGEANVLPGPDLTALEDETSEKLWEIIAGISAGVRPEWATEGMAKSALDLGTHSAMPPTPCWSGEPTTAGSNSGGAISRARCGS